MRIRDGPGRAENRIQNQNQRAGVSTGDIRLL